MDTKALRQKILDLAIRGKLVPQNPEDEPASVLLERIRLEKRQMVKDGKLKAKDIKNDSVIFVGEDSLHYEKFADGTVKCIEDEIPFEVPEGWAWSRLLSLTVKIGAGSTPTGGSSAYNNMGIKFIRSQNVYNDGLDLANVAYISEELNQKKSGRYRQANRATPSRPRARRRQTPCPRPARGYWQAAPFWQSRPQNGTFRRKNPPSFHACR